MNIDPSQIGAFPMLAMVRDTSTGEIRWPVVIGGIITAGVVGVSSWLISASQDIAYIKARQEMVITKLASIEASSHPATSKRYTSDDAARDQDMMRRELDRLGERIAKLEDRRK